MTTLRQIAANRRNAEKSTGPRTGEGKAASRGNALVHGLAGAGVVLPDEEGQAVAERKEQWRGAYDPATEEEEWLFTQVVVNSVRLDRCQLHDATLREYDARRAALCWDDDRRLDAEETALALARKPAAVSRRLRRTRQGCEWLLERWNALGAALDRQGAWTEAQTSMALDLLGTPAALRDQPPPDDPAALVAREIARLSRLKAEALDELDEFERETAVYGLDVTPGPALARLRRYEAACLRRLEWASNRLRARAAQSPATAPVAPTPFTPPPAPAPVVEPRREPEWGPFTRGLLTASLAGVLAPEPEPEAEPEPEPGPEPARASAPVGRPVAVASAASPHLNRRARRAAQKLAARRR